MKVEWMDVNVALPEDDQRVLGFIPGNKVFLPGKDLQFETREVVVLRFLQGLLCQECRKAGETRPSLLGR